MNLHHLLLCVSISLIGSEVQAQTLTNADTTTLQPIIGRDAKGFKSCGMRAVSIVNAGKFGKVYDFSVNVDAELMSGLAKAGMYTQSELLSKSKSAKINAVLPAPTGFWIAAAKQGAPVRMDKTIPAETPGFILGTVELVPALKAIMDMATGERMQFAVKYKTDPVEQVISFSTQLPKVDMDALLACVEGVHGRMVELGEQLYPKKK